jgi:hypothetical protein
VVFFDHVYASQAPQVAVQIISAIYPTLIAMKTTPFTCLQNDARDFHASASTTDFLLYEGSQKTVFTSETVMALPSHS